MKHVHGLKEMQGNLIEATRRFDTKETNSRPCTSQSVFIFMPLGTELLS